MSTALLEKPGNAGVGTLVRNSDSKVVPKPVRLTNTELFVLARLHEGYSSQEIADLPGHEKSKRTVDFHCANIYDKLLPTEVRRNRVKAIRAAVRLGLLPFEPNIQLFD